jgi:DMSO/TMAO reductase YedYZ molybdopterin-dependent catalytic subunit
MRMAPRKTTAAIHMAVAAAVAAPHKKLIPTQKESGPRAAFFLYNWRMADSAYNEKLIAAKMKQLERFRRERRQRGEAQKSQRLPPGQHVVPNVPVLDLGVHPPFDPKTWSFTVDGEVENPITFTWEEFQALPQTDIIKDFHCVTTWSSYDLKWRGVRLQDLAKIVQPKDSANFAIMESYDGYTTNTSVHEALGDDALLATHLGGEPLAIEHGGPMRMMIPTLYAWKSAKFLKKLTFSLRDKPGYWEIRGYHMVGDPWKEERHGEPGTDGFESLEDPKP